MSSCNLKRHPVLPLTSGVLLLGAMASKSFKITGGDITRPRRALVAAAVPRTKGVGVNFINSEVLNQNDASSEKIDADLFR